MKDKSFGVIPVLRKEGKNFFVLIHQVLGHWAFPKGHAEVGESEVETARRELYEETGIKDCEIYSDIFFLENYVFNNNEREVKYFLGIIKNPELSPVMKNEVQNIKLLEFDEAIKMLTHEEPKAILKQVVEKLKSI